MGRSTDQHVDAIFYPAVIKRCHDSFRVSFPDLPRCSSEGETWQDACRNAELALSSYLDLSSRHGQPVAEPSPGMMLSGDAGDGEHILVRGERTF